MYAAPRPNRKLARQVDVITHNPLVDQFEDASSYRWAPSKCSWVTTSLGGTDVSLQMMTRAIENYRFPLESDGTGGDSKKGIRVKVDNISRKYHFMNATNTACYMSIYRCRPRKDLAIAETPLAVLMTQPYVHQGTIFDTNASGNIAYDVDDYRYTPFMNKRVVSEYNVKYLKNVKIQPGASFIFSDALRYSINNTQDVETDTYVMRKGQGLLHLFKTWGDWGIATPSDPESTVADLRPAEGQVAFRYTENRHYHPKHDTRPVYYNNHITGDNSGVTLTIRDPSNDGGIYGTFGPALGTFP